MKRHLLASLISAACAASCGGGGGANSTTTRVETRANLSGVAAKGVMAHARVTVHRVVNGAIEDAPFTDAVLTDDQGNYQLPRFLLDPGRYYVVKVTAIAGTTYLDEITGNAEPLPNGFTLRAVLMPLAQQSDSPSLSVYVTPFSDMAVDAALRAPGAMTTGNIEQALSNAQQLLGFDPRQSRPRTIADAALFGGSESQTLAVALTSILRMAGVSTDPLTDQQKKLASMVGCNSGAVGQRVQCVVSRLSRAGSARSDNFKPGSVDGVDMASALDNAITDVLLDLKLNPSQVPADSVGKLLANLEGNGAAVPVSNLSVTSSAKLLFADLKGVFASLFSRGDVARDELGGFNREVALFHATAQGTVKPAAATLFADAGLALKGVEVLNDFRRGAPIADNNELAPNIWAGGKTSLFPVLVAGSQDAMCAVEKPDGTSAVAPKDAKQIRCWVRFAADVEEQPDHTYTEKTWVHQFVITSASIDDNSKFSYVSGLKQIVTTCPQRNADVSSCKVGAPTDLVADPKVFKGSVTVTFSADKTHITHFELSGDLPPTINPDTGTYLDGGHNHWDFAGTQEEGKDPAYNVPARRLMLDKPSSNQSAGNSFQSLDASGVLRLRVDLAATAFGSPYQLGGLLGTNADASLAANWDWFDAGGKVTHSFLGQFKRNGIVKDKSKTRYTSGQASLDGQFFSYEGGAKKLLLQGVLSDSITGFENYDSTKANRPAVLGKDGKLTDTGNFYKHSLSFSGVVTAVGRPRVDISVGYLAVFDGASPATFSGTFKLSNGSGKLLRSIAIKDGKVVPDPMVDAKGLPVLDALGNQKLSYGAGNWVATLSDAGSGLSLTIGHDRGQEHAARNVILHKDMAVAGTIDVQNAMVYIPTEGATDSFSVDLGIL